MKTVIIRQLPVESFSYFQWFLLGLYMLRDRGEIKLKFRISFIDRLCLFFFDSKWIAGTVRRLINLKKYNLRYNLIGEVIDSNRKATFVIDSKDSPFVFTLSDLEHCDAYFKNQCPKEFNKEGFKIANGIILPWQDVHMGDNDSPYKYVARKVAYKIYDLRHKIYAGMVGPRRMGWSLRSKRLYNEYETKFSHYSGERKKLTAYFGSANYPKMTKELECFDFDWESNLMAYMKGHSHPNEKRVIATEILNHLGTEYEGRLIQDKNGIVHNELVIPLEKFGEYISHFQYNLNISGFRLSIPNRFIESFMVGTCIVTDKLSVKWFKPFEHEVIETVTMGYEKDKDVDWAQFKNDMVNLPDTDRDLVKKSFLEKWAPYKFAEYVINTTLGSKS